MLPPICRIFILREVRKGRRRNEQGGREAGRQAQIDEEVEGRWVSTQIEREVAR